MTNILGDIEITVDYHWPNFDGQSCLLNEIGLPCGSMLKLNASPSDEQISSLHKHAVRLVALDGSLQFIGERHKIKIGYTNGGFTKVQSIIYTGPQ